MTVLFENVAIRDITRLSDQVITVNGYKGVTASVNTEDGEFDGTVVYFPGVTIQHLEEKCEVQEPFVEEL